MNDDDEAPATEGLSGEASPLGDSRDTRAAPLRAVRQRLLSFRSDTMIASLAVLAFCLLLSIAFFVLSWTVYRERYGISFLDFVRMAF